MNSSEIYSKMFIKTLLLCFIGVAACVEVHFENKDGGFFLKHTGRGAGGPGSGSGGVGAAPLSVDRFTVFQTARAVSVRASYGPFSTKQTVPARSLVPDPLAPFPGSKNSSLEQTPLRLDMSAHVVSREISRDTPVIRVLFHTGGEAGGRVCGVVHATMGNRPSLTGACSPEGGEGACLAQLEIPANWWGPLQPPPTLKDGKTVAPIKQPPKYVQLAYSVLEPRVADPEGGGCMPRVQIQPATRLGSVQLVPARAPFKELHADDSLTLLAPRTPLYPLARFHLPVFVRHEEIPVTYFVMRCRVRTGIRLLGAVSVSDQWSITVELKPKLGTVTAVRKDFADQQSPPTSEEVFTWAAEAGGAAGRGSARLSCSVRYARSTSSLMASPLTLSENENEHEITEHPTPRKIILKMDIDKDDIQAVLPISKNWEVLNTAVVTGRQVSQAMKVLIVSQAGQVADVTLQSSCHSEDESVLKVSSSCSSVYVDGSEIRSSSNASVIVKYGTYTGLARFTVWMPEFPLEVNVDDFRLSQVKGWKVPEEGNSNGITKNRGLRRRRSYSQPVMEEISNSVTPDRHSCRLRFQQSPVDVYARFLATDHDSGRISYLVSRRTLLRVTELVLPLLRVADPRLATLRGRLLRGKATGRTEVQVLSPITGRVIGSREIRVGSDKVSISRLIVRVISGLQLNISPDNAIENGYVSETTVTRRLTAQYQEGLLDIDIEFSDGSRTPLRDVAMEDYVLKVESLDTDVVAFAPMVASHHPRVIAVGEGNGELLRVTLLLSEECRGAAGAIPKTRGSSNKVDPGGGGSTGVLLATATASVEVDFSASEVPQRPDTPQNDDIMRSGAKGPLADLHDILIGIPLKDENNHEPTVQARQLGGSNLPGGLRGDRRRHAPHMTPVEIGMYVLLAAFCFAIVIFVVSCVVYASKFKPIGPENMSGLGPAMPLQPIAPDAGKIQVAGLIGTSLGIGRDNRKLPRESTTNAHDWVWLGRATIERHTGHQVQAMNRSTPQVPPPPPPHASDVANRNIPKEMRITNNPLNMNYADPEDAIKPADNNNGNVQVTSFENPTHIDGNEPINVERRARSHSNDNRIVDSTTYSKRDRLGRAGKQNGTDAPRSWQDTSNPPPPLPPHATPIDGRVISPEEYRPPVPPHRTSQPPVNTRNKGLADTIMPPTRRSHHNRHHWKSSDKPVSHQSQQHPPQPVGSPRKTYMDNRMVGRHNPNIEPSNGNDENTNDISELGNINSLVNNPSKTEGMFEFDEDIQMAEVANDDSQHVRGELNAEVHCERDASDNAKENKLQSSCSPDLMKDSGIGLGEVVYRPKVPKHATQPTESTNADFVEIAGDNNGASSRGSSPEVKRATIVGNPMFSGSPSNKSITDELPTESLGLDDLEMDYEQIMHYFHNLKESNA